MGGDSTEGHTYLWQRSSGRWRRHGGSRGRGRGRWDWHGGPSDTCRNTHSYDAIMDTVELVLPVDSGAASSAFATDKKQEGAPSREIGYTMTPPPQSHPPTPSFPNCPLVEEQWPLLCGREQTSTLRSLSQETPQEKATVCTHCSFFRNGRVRHVSRSCHRGQQLSRNGSRFLTMLPMSHVSLETGCAPLGPPPKLLDIMKS